MTTDTHSTAGASSLAPSDTPVETALAKASGPRRAEADELIALLGELTGRQPVVWGTRIIGFGEHPYGYDSGRTGRAPELAFATGAAHHTLYLADDFANRWPDLVARLGKHRASKACLYLTRLNRIDRAVLRELLECSLAHTRANQNDNRT